MHQIYHPKFNIGRLYLPHKEGGRGLVWTELSLKTTVIGMGTYLNNTMTGCSN